MEAKEIISSGLLELYATGLASADEVTLVQMYVVDYPEVANELADIMNSLEAYATSFAVEPDASLKNKIFSKIDGEPASKVIITNDLDTYDIRKNLNHNGEIAKVVNIPAYWKYAAAASIVMLLGSIAVNISLYNKSFNSAKNLQRTQQQLAVLQEETKLMEDDIQVVQNKYSRPVSLRGLEAAPNAAAKIFWIENTGELYIDPSNLPEAPAGKQYQLWGIVDGKPVDAGMIKTFEKHDKFSIQKMKSFGRAEALLLHSKMKWVINLLKDPCSFWVRCKIFQCIIF